jgi:hypothetical protein
MNRIRGIDADATPLAWLSNHVTWSEHDANSITVFNMFLVISRRYCISEALP